MVTVPIPTTWTAGDRLDSETLNRELRDILNYLLGRGGAIVSLNAIDIRAAGENNGVGWIAIPGQQSTGRAVINGLPLTGDAIIIYSDNGVLSYRTLQSSNNGIVNAIESLHSATAEVNGGILYTTDDRNPNGADADEQAVNVLGRPATAPVAVLTHGRDNTAPAWTAPSVLMLPDVNIEINSNDENDTRVMYQDNAAVTSGTASGAWWTFKTANRSLYNGTVFVRYELNNQSGGNITSRIINQDGTVLQQSNNIIPSGASWHDQDHGDIRVSVNDVLTLQLGSNTNVGVRNFDIRGRIILTPGMWT